MIGSSNYPFHGYICNWDPVHSNGIIRGFSGTHYEFSSEQMAQKYEKPLVRLGFPVTYLAVLKHRIFTAVRISINWEKLLVKIHQWSWHGPSMPINQFSMFGIVTSWHKGSRGVVQVGQLDWTTSFQVNNIPAHSIDKLTICKSWPVFLDLTRDDTYLVGSNFRTCGLRVAWEKVLETYHDHLRLVGVSESDWNATRGMITPRPVAHEGNQLTFERETLRPQLAEIVALPSDSTEKDNVVGLLRPVDGKTQSEARLTFTIGASWPEGRVLERGQMILYWTTLAGKEHACLLIVRPRFDGSWPSIIFSPHESEYF